jgi:hypothetical protein
MKAGSLRDWVLISFLVYSTQVSSDEVLAQHGEGRWVLGDGETKGVVWGSMRDCWGVRLPKPSTKAGNHSFPNQHLFICHLHRVLCLF